MTTAADAARRMLLDLNAQYRAQVETLVQQTEASLFYDWQRGMAAAPHLYQPLLDRYAAALNQLRLTSDDPAAALSLDWLTNQNPLLASIEQSVKASAEKYAQDAAAAVEHGQQASATLGEGMASELTQAALFPASEVGVDPAMLFNRPNPDAIASFVGRAGDGHPLGDLFANFGAEATTEARKVLATGLLLGQNPLAMVSGLSQAMGISRSRAAIIARTEILGSYRDAAHETYRANSDVLNYWLWSAGGNNPCAMCMGMDGTLHDLNESLDDHPCGKCAPLPVTKGWDEILGPLGIDTSDLQDTSLGAPGAYETGEEKFARMSPEQQRAILGTNTGYEAYRRGEVTLRDFVGVRPAEHGFPSSYYQKSLKELQIPTRQARRLVEPRADLLEKYAAGTLRYSDLGKLTPDELMPAWAKQSESSRIVYQILRNGLPYDLTAHEQGLLIVNLEQMLKGELPLNVRAAAERQLLALGQTVERQTVGKMAQEAAMRETDAAIEAAMGRAATHIAPEDVAKFAEGNAEGVPSIGYHYSKSPESIEALKRSGIDLTYQAERQPLFGRGFYMWDTPFPTKTFGEEGIQVAIHMENPFRITSYKQWQDLYAEYSAKGLKNWDARLTRDLLKQGYDGILVVGTKSDSVNFFEADPFFREGQVIAIKPGTVRVIEDALGQTVERQTVGAAAQVAEGVANAAVPDLQTLINPAIAAAARGDVIETVAEVRARVVADLAQRLDTSTAFDALVAGGRFGATPEEALQTLLGSWDQGEGTVYRALQEAVQDALKLRDVASPFEGAATEDALRLYAENRSGLQAFVREMYRNTQNYLSANGISDVTVYRGVSFETLPEGLRTSLFNGDLHTITLPFPPANAFSADPKIAEIWANNAFMQGAQEAGPYRLLIRETAPASQVLSTAQTGMGSLQVSEVIMLGGRREVIVLGTDSGEYLANALGQTVGVATRTAEQAAAAKTIEQDVATLTGDELRAEAESLKALVRIDAEARPDFDLHQLNLEQAQHLQSKAEMLRSNPNWRKFVKAIGAEPFELGSGITCTPEMYAVLTLESEWGTGVIDENVMNVALRDMAREIFDLPPPSRGLPYADVRAEADDLLKGYRSALRAYVQATYQQTQDWFAERGITEVTLYRGSNNGTALAGLSYDSQAVAHTVVGPAFSSYSIDPSIALGYADSGSIGGLGGAYRGLIAMRVPVTDIFGVPDTSMAAQTEGEFLLLGRSHEAAVFSWQGVEGSAPPLDNALDRVSEILAEIMGRRS